MKHIWSDSSPFSRISTPTVKTISIKNLKKKKKTPSQRLLSVEVTMFGRNCAARGARVNMKNDWRSWQTVCFSFFFFVWMISACNPQSAMTEISVEPSTTTMQVHPFLVRGCNWLEIIKSDGQFINLFDWSLLWYHGGEQLKKMEWKRLCFFSEIVLSRNRFLIPSSLQWEILKQMVRFGYWWVIDCFQLSF